MSRKNIQYYLASIILATTLSSCQERTHISFSCEKDSKNNYILKWEVFPEKDHAKIEILLSDNDSIFPKKPIKTMMINDYIAIIPSKEDTLRQYFKLKVGNIYSGVISNRFFETDNIQNWRDIGGYPTKSGKQVKWGKIFRSGNLSKLSPKDREVLAETQIKTIVDFRYAEQGERKYDVYEAANYVHIPIRVSSFDQNIKKRILDCSFLKGDAIIHIQDCYRSIINDYSEQYANFFELLCDEKNYPVVFHCGLGKERTGLASFFILTALDVPVESIKEDFLLSDKTIDKVQVMQEGKNLPDEIQEAIGMILTTDISQLKYAIYCMKKKSGSVENYMTKELRLTEQKRAKLKKILLYP